MDNSGTIMIIVLIALSCIFTTTQAKVSYHQSQVLEIIPQTIQQLEALQYIEDNDFRGFNFWAGPTKLNQSVHVLVPQTLKQEFQGILANLNLYSKVYIEDVQKLIENENPRSKSTRFGWSAFYQLDEINDFLRQLASTHPNTVTLIRGGQTYEGRDILGIRIRHSNAPVRRAAFLEGGIHAREWISPATVLYLTNELITSNNSTIRLIAQSFDWYAFPVLNPDGFVYTHTTDRMWRKTRTRNSGGSCVGADPNRNWAYQWMNGGASQVACADTYAGPSPFSEPSTRSMSEFISTIGRNLTVYLSFHSYSQLLLLPYGHTSQQLDNYAEARNVGVRAAQALASRYNTQYRVGNVAETIYIASGSSADWVKATFGTRFVYTYELRDLGRYGFVLPASQILPNCLEVLDSFIVILNAAIGV